MPARWWGRAIGPAIVTFLVAGSTAAVGADAGPVAAARWELVGRTADGAVALRVSLPDGRFTLEYRNSLYGSPAAEHFAVTDDGRLALVGLAATDAAILQEYYGAASPRRPTIGSWAGWWHAPPAAPLELASLTVAATRHGERTLVAGDDRILLWRTAPDSNPGITLEARPAG